MDNTTDNVKVMLNNLREQMNKQDKYFDFTIEENQIIIHENAFYRKRWPSHTIPTSHIATWITYRLNNHTQVTEVNH